MSAENEVRDMVNSWLTAINRRDVTGCIANHSPDILLFDVPYPVQLKGIESYKKSWEGFFNWTGEKGGFSLSDIHVTADANLAFCTGLIKCSGTETNGQFVNLDVRLTMCLSKINGKWLIVHEHHSEPSK